MTNAVNAAADISMLAAMQYCEKKKNLDYRSDAAIDRLLVALRVAVKEALPGALDDAQDARAANIGTLAATTFSASMRLAGITAAKAYEAELAA